MTSSTRVAATAVVGSGVALVGFAPFGWHDHERAIRNGGHGMYVLLALAVLMPALTAIVAVRAPRPWMFSLVALPTLAASAIAWFSGRSLDAAIDATIGDLVPRIVADGISEVETPRVLGHLASAACAMVIAASATRAPGKPPKIAMLAGGAWILASVVVFGAWLKTRELVGVSFLVPVLVVGVVSIALWMQRDGSSAVVVSVAAIAAVCLFEYAIIERLEVTTLGAISGEHVEPAQRTRILTTLLPVYGYARVAIPLHLVLGAVTFFVSMRRPTARAVLGAFAFAAAFVATFTAEGLQRRRRIASAKNAFSFATDLTLPTTPLETGRLGFGRRVLLNAHGEYSQYTAPDEEDEEPLTDAPVTTVSPRGEMGMPAVAILADAHLTCGTLAEKLHLKSRKGRHILTADVPDRDRDTRAFLGNLEPLAGGRSLSGFSLDLRHHGSPLVAEILSGSMRVTLVTLAPLTISLALAPTDAAHELVAYVRDHPLAIETSQAITVIAHDSDSVQSLVTALTILDTAFAISQEAGRIYRVSVEP